jgi:DNA primase
MSLPDGMDPDDTVKKLGKDGFIALQKQAKPLIEYRLFLCEKLMGDSIEQQKAYTNACLEVLRELKSTVEKESYLPTIAQKSGQNIDILRRALYEDAPKEKKEVTINEGVGVDKSLKGKDVGYYTASRFILATMLAGKTYDIDGESLGAYFDDKSHIDIFNYVSLCRQENKPIVAGNLFGVVDDDELNAIIGTRLAPNEEDSEKRFFKESALRIKKKFLEKRIKTLSELIKKEQDADKKKLYLEELNSLIIPTKK